MQAAHGQPERPFFFTGMGDEKQGGLAVQIATLTQQMRSVAASVEDIKRSVQPFADLDRGFAEMRVRAESVREDVGLLWARSHAEERARLDQASDIVEVDRKVDAMGNRATGAVWVLGIGLERAVRIFVFEAYSCPNEDVCLANRKPRRPSCRRFPLSCWSSSVTAQ
ncbi:hypothetical protein F3J16_05865 [Burkholderia sp. Ap-962]|uniref:hypothetical protein n=1 Tax=Burkholderia sp. Ap-962 TaxID=2608333 RepID=UPI001423DC71|nr:hypothetical protein [Burkholderia sp. Ap-962]NIF69718.1 hypothetical protein [Burkholderia sp. Ap-962]